MTNSNNMVDKLKTMSQNDLVELIIKNKDDFPPEASDDIIESYATAIEYMTDEDLRIHIKQMSSDKLINIITKYLCIYVIRDYDFDCPFSNELNNCEMSCDDCWNLEI